MDKLFTRRIFLTFSLFIPIINIVNAKSICEPTPKQPLGPFYKIPNNTDNFDMSNNGRARGKIIEITGKVINKNCKPYKFAIIDIWQANHFGKYNHINDGSNSKKDKYFNGYIRIKTNKKGEYKLKTIMPGSYNISKNIIRTPHLHFRVILKNKQLTTQMYFKGHENNNNDFLYRRLKNHKNVSVSLVKEKNSKIKSGKFNIII